MLRSLWSSEVIEQTSISRTPSGVDAYAHSPPPSPPPSPRGAHLRFQDPNLCKSQTTGYDFFLLSLSSHRRVRVCDARLLHGPIHRSTTCLIVIQLFTSHYTHEGQAVCNARVPQSQSQNQSPPSCSRARRGTDASLLASAVALFVDSQPTTQPLTQQMTLNPTLQVASSSAAAAARRACLLLLLNSSSHPPPLTNLRYTASPALLIMHRSGLRPHTVIAIQERKRKHRVINTRTHRATRHNTCTLILL